MRQLSLGVTVVALFGLAACQQKEAAHDDLAADLASVSSNSDLALAPNSAGRNTVSAVEQLATHTRVAPSRRSTPHRTPHVDRRSPKIAEVAVAAEPEPEPEAMQEVTEAPPEVVAPRPQPVEPSVGTVASGDGGMGGQGSGGGVDAGRVIGTIFGVVLRGGVADGDHCDPRRSAPHIPGGVPTGRRSIPNVRY